MSNGIIVIIENKLKIHKTHNTRIHEYNNTQYTIEQAKCWPKEGEAQPGVSGQLF